MSRPTKPQRATSFLSVSLALALFATLLPSSAAVAATTDSLCPTDYTRPEVTSSAVTASLAPTAEPPVRSESPPPPQRNARLGGTWHDLPRSPFSAASPTAVWAGDRMVVIDHRRGRTAAYYPPTRRWEEHQRIPGRSGAQGSTFNGAPHAVWTGDEVIVFGGRTGPDTDWVEWYAFDPGRGRWRDVAPSPLKQRGLQTAWTGDLLLVVGGDRSAAAYDPAADCWLEMPEAPLLELPENERTLRLGEWGVSSTHWTGAELLAVVVGPWPRNPTGIVTFDPGSWTWAAGSVGPIAGTMVDPVLAGETLWFMTEDSNDAFGGRYVTNATYDPPTDTWSAFDTGCPVNTRWATWTGRLIMEPYSDRRAFDPITGQCFRTRASKDRARQWEPVWTGREFLYWSGAYGDTARGRPDGIAYRPPRAAITSEQAKLLGKKLRRAISARHKWGFETDPDVVREIMRDPHQPGSRQHGFPMTEAEQQDLWRRGGLATQASGIKRWLRKEPIYGGIWQDQRAGGTIAIALTEADPDVIARVDLELQAHGGCPDGEYPWRLVIVPHSHAALMAAFRRAVKVSRDLDPTAMLWAVGVDESAGAIEMMYDPNDAKRMRARKKQLEKKLGVPVRITSGRVRDT